MAGKGTPVVIVKAEGDEEVKTSSAAGSSDAGGGGEVGAQEAEIKFVEMPEDYVNWILAQEIRPVFSLDEYPATSEVIPQKWHDEQLELLASVRESLLASREEFSKYQAWVREEYEREGRVMVPDVHPEISEEQEELNRTSLQEEVDRIFAQAAEEYARDHPELLKMSCLVRLKEMGTLIIAATADPNSQRFSRFKSQFAHLCGAVDSLAVAAASGGEAEETNTKLVEMPESHVRWILAQEMRPVFTLDDYSITAELYPQEHLDEKRELLSSIRESLLASQADFAKYQASIREEYEREGRVMVPVPIDEAQEELDRLSLQEEIDRLFAQGAEEFERDHPDLVKLIAEVEAKNEAAETDSKTGDIIAGTTDSNCS